MEGSLAVRDFCSDPGFFAFFEGPTDALTPMSLIELPQAERSRHLLLDALGSPRQSLWPRHLGSERRLHILVASELQGSVAPRRSEEVERPSRRDVSICVCRRERLRG